MIFEAVVRCTIKWPFYALQYQNKVQNVISKHVLSCCVSGLVNFYVLCSHALVSEIYVFVRGKQGNTKKIKSRNTVHSLRHCNSRTKSPIKKLQYATEVADKSEQRRWISVNSIVFQVSAKSTWKGVWSPIAAIYAF